MLKTESSASIYDRFEAMSHYSNSFIPNVAVSRRNLGSWIQRWLALTVGDNTVSRSVDHSTSSDHFTVWLHPEEIKLVEAYSKPNNRGTFELDIPQPPSSTNSVYDRFKSGTIRVFRLLPRGNPTSPNVKVQLDTFRHRNLKYIALSYTWGSVSDRSLLEVNGKKLYIPTNLYQALEQLQVEECQDSLWADSICINQEDEDEKAALVPKMDKIYAEASRVIAWLGISPGFSGAEKEELLIRTNEETDIFGSLQCIGEQAWSTDMLRKGKQYDDGISLSPSQLLFDLDDVYQRCAPYLKSIFINDKGRFPTKEYQDLSRNSYWTRVWILQEVYLGKDVSYMYGKSRLSRRNLVAALRLLERFQNNILISNSPRDVGYLGVQPKLEEEYLWNRLQSFAVHDAPDPAMLSQVLYTCLLPPKAISLKLAMAHFSVSESPRRFSASDPRDYIYGLLGFATAGEKAIIIPKYSSSARNIFGDTAKKLIHHGFTDMLSWAQGETKGYRLPSWVPDISASIYEPMCSQYQARPWLPKFSAMGLRMMMQPRNDLHHLLFLTGISVDELFVTGLTVDEVEKIGSLWLPRGENGNRSASSEAIATYLVEIQKFCSLSEAISGGPAGLQGKKMQEAQWRVPIADQMLIGSKLQRAGMEAAAAHSEILKQTTNTTMGYIISMPKSPRLNTTLSSLASAYLATAFRWANRRPFLTAKGYVGLLPENALPGDILVVFAGFSATYIVRRFIQSETLRYSLIGEAYCFGIMDGEFAELPNAEQAFILV